MITEKVRAGVATAPSASPIRLDEPPSRVWALLERECVRVCCCRVAGHTFSMTTLAWLQRRRSEVCGRARRRSQRARCARSVSQVNMRVARHALIHDSLTHHTVWTA